MTASSVTFLNYDAEQAVRETLTIAGLISILQNSAIAATIFAPTEAAFASTESPDTVHNIDKLSLALTNSVSLGRRDVTNIRSALQAQVLPSDNSEQIPEGCSVTASFIPASFILSEGLEL